MTVAPPAMSSFIRSMPSAGLMEMPPVSNVTPLPTRPRMGVARRAVGLVARDQHPRRLVAAARDAEEQPHPELLHPPLVQHLHRDAGQRQHRLSPADELARRQAIARLVDEHARRVHRIPDAHAAFDRSRGARAAGARDFDGRDEAPLVVAALQMAVVVVRQRDAFRQRFDRRRPPRFPTARRRCARVSAVARASRRRRQSAGRAPTLSSLPGPAPTATTCRLRQAPSAMGSASS